MSGSALTPTRKTKVFTAFFFAVHYGGFHLVYLVFMLGFVAMARNPVVVGEGISSAAFGLAVFSFFLNHAFSFFYNRRGDVEKRAHLSTVMMYPYIRIIPMHLTIIFGNILLMAGYGLYALFLFLFLKTAADIVMHISEHHKAPKTVANV